MSIFSGGKNDSGRQKHLSGLKDMKKKDGKQ
jgi:hypothetical protein